MSKSVELKKIKKVYGEKFMKLCRELFPTLIEQEILYDILSSSFSENCKTLYEDIVNKGLEGDFKNYIYSKVDVEKENKIKEKKTPYELLEEAGYDLIECTTEEEIQELKKYYARDEELCTFRGGRLNRCVVFFAVKKDVDDIKREDFLNPKREDEYGTSVMGIQFNRSGICTVSIKNRYNHTVNNPDATYGNDLDRIIPGLTQSFTDLLLQRGLELNSKNIEKMTIPGYTVANDGKYYKYNIELMGDYCCPGNIIIENGNANKLEKTEKQILIDYFILDMENKTIQLYNENLKDSFTKDFQDLEKIEIRKNKEEGNGVRSIVVKKRNQEKPIIIEIDKNNQIIRYKNNELAQVGDNFLFKNQGLIQLEVPNLVQIGDSFLFSNQGLTQLEVPNLTQVGDEFLDSNQGLTQLEVPNLVQTGDNFLFSNQGLTQLEVPNLTQVGDEFLDSNQGLTQLEVPNLVQTGNSFLFSNEALTQLEAPNLTQVGDNFLWRNEGLTQLEVPNLTQVGDFFLNNNRSLTQLKAPNLTRTGNEFLLHNQGLTQLKLPNLTQVGYDFLWRNQGLTQLEAPNLTQVGNDFLCSNQALTQLKVPNLVLVGDYFLRNNQGLTQLEAPNLTQVGNDFLCSNQALTQLEAPNLVQIGDDFLKNNQGLTELEEINRKEKNPAAVSLWKNRFSGWCNSMESEKDKFDIAEAMSEKLKERTDRNETNER